MIASYKDSRVPALTAALVLLVLWTLASAFSTAPRILIGMSIALASLPPLLWALTTYPDIVPYLLIFSIQLGILGAKVQISGLNIRPNMVVALLIAFFVATRLVVGRERWRPLPHLGIFLLTGAVYLFSTLINFRSPFLARGIADCFLFLLNVLQYALLVWFLAWDSNTFERALRFFVYCTTALSGLYLVLFMLVASGVQVGNQLLTEIEGETGAYTRIGNLGVTEGSYIAFNLVLLLSATILASRNPPWTTSRTSLMLACNGGALLLTFGRGPWLAVGIVTFMVMLLALLRLSWKQVGSGALRLAIILLAVSMMCGWYLVRQSDVTEMLFARFQALTLLEAGTAADRLMLWTDMWRDFQSAPLLGHGAHNYAKFREDPSTQISENFVLEMFHSAGLLGGGLFLAANLWIVFRAIRIFSRQDKAVGMPWGLPLVAGYLSMFLSSLTNPGMTGGYFWAGLGLLVASTELARRPLKAAAFPAAGYPVTLRPSAAQS